jgi:AbrB family looped-hinge helix DNA binding protein
MLFEKPYIFAAPQSEEIHEKTESMNGHVKMASVMEDLLIYGTAKVGERGQIVIPAEARKEFGIRAGDILLVVRGVGRQGIVLVKAETVRELVAKVMAGLAQEREEAGQSQEVDEHSPALGHDRGPT